jgi:hypothetical protein
LHGIWSLSGAEGEKEPSDEDKALFQRAQQKAIADIPKVGVIALSRFYGVSLGNFRLQFTAVIVFND